MIAFDLVFGHRERARLRLSILGYAHPEIAEPEGFDLLDVRLDVSAGSVTAEFAVQIHDFELSDLAEYLGEIVSGNGPARALTFAGGMLELSFAPSRRGPVLLGVILKEVDDAHLRLEYLVTLEPHEIGNAAAALDRLKSL